LQTITNSVKNQPENTFLDHKFFIKEFESSGQDGEYQVGNTFVLGTDGEISKLSGSTPSPTNLRGITRDVVKEVFYRVYYDYSTSGEF
jgi:hypothetical protein